MGSDFKEDKGNQKELEFPNNDFSREYVVDVDIKYTIDEKELSEKVVDVFQAPTIQNNSVTQLVGKIEINVAENKKRFEFKGI